MLSPLFSGLSVLFLLIIFVVIWVWAWRPQRKSNFDLMASLPLNEDDKLLKECDSKKQGEKEETINSLNNFGGEKAQ